VLKTKTDCRLIIAGSGNYDTCLQEAKDSCTKITFTGLLAKDKLYELYRIADIGVVPSLFESFGYVTVEMMMHGLPLVATSTSGLNEVVDESCGLKVPLTELPDRVDIDISLLAQKDTVPDSTSCRSKGNGTKRKKQIQKDVYFRDIRTKNVPTLSIIYSLNRISRIILQGRYIL
jgi:glycosyltransferase involved in cell wall biosynthesis